jgi:hypothetical protein
VSCMACWRGKLSVKGGPPESRRRRWGLGAGCGGGRTERWAKGKKGRKPSSERTQNFILYIYFLQFFKNMYPVSKFSKLYHNRYNTADRVQPPYDTR